MAVLTNQQLKSQYPNGYRLFINGREITKICVEFDIEAGWARLYVMEHDRQEPPPNASPTGVVPVPSATPLGQASTAEAVIPTGPTTTFPAPGERTFAPPGAPVAHAEPHARKTFVEHGVVELRPHA